MKDIRIALGQLTCLVGDLEGNLAKHCEFTRMAAREGAKIICFPESSLTGYPKYEDKKMKEHAQSVGDPLAFALADLSKETGLTVLAGIIEVGDQVVYNTQLVADAGRIVGVYRKTHISESEATFFASGGDLPVFSHSSAKYGVQICYDNHFPEAARTLALRGAEIIFCPYASPGPCTQLGYEAKQARWLRYQTARAFDNSVYMCLVNQVGECGYTKRLKRPIESTPEDTHSDLLGEFPGGSMVLDPWGNVVARAKPEVEDLLIVDLEAATLYQKREDSLNFFTRYRRPDLYGELC